MTRAVQEPALDACRLAATACACQGVRRAARAVSRLYEAALAPVGLTATQFAILVAANLRGPVPLSRLAEVLVLDRTSLYRALRPLERRSALRVVPGRDRREKDAVLTAAGRRLLAEALPLWRGAQDRMVRALGAGEWARLADGLSRMTDAALGAQPSPGA